VATRNARASVLSGTRITEKTATIVNLQPITMKEARRFVQDHHRHNVAPPGGKFAIGLSDGSEVVGVVIVSRPIARMFDNGWTAEVTRCCVKEGIRNGCSMLYGAAWRAARAMGYLRLVTYIRSDEPGTSLMAVGWKCIAKREPRSWAKEYYLPRVDTTEPTQRKLFEITLDLEPFVAMIDM